MQYPALNWHFFYKILCSLLYSLEMQLYNNLPALRLLGQRQFSAG